MPSVKALVLAAAEVARQVAEVEATRHASRHVELLKYMHICIYNHNSNNVEI